MKQYTKIVEAIQWDGSHDTLLKLRDIFKDDPVFFITDGDSEESKNGLRVHKLKTQGDYFVLIGDYLLFDDGTLFHVPKSFFEKTFKPL